MPRGVAVILVTVIIVFLGPDAVAGEMRRGVRNLGAVLARGCAQSLYGHRDEPLGSELIGHHDSPGPKVSNELRAVALEVVEHAGRRAREVLGDAL
jgi:hypothetical protein